MVLFKDNVMKILLGRKVNESYKIIFGDGLFPQIAADLKESPVGSKYAIITDSNVKPLYADSLEELLKNEGLEVATFSFEAGEPNKTIYSVAEILEQMGEAKYGRDSAILALGGGVVGDMAGFIGAILNRGIKTIQIPTTVLAQADSSVGGKTGVDLNCGKNLVGRIVQPEKVYIDVSTLKTLSKRNYIAGLAEAVKHGVIRDAEFFKYLQENVDSILERSSESSLYIAKKNCRIKGNVVEVDPNEKGLRRILNYGHTVGHAVEQISVSKFRENSSVEDYLSHGEAVSIGMVAAGEMSKLLGYFPQKDLDSQKDLLSKFGLSTAIPEWMSNDEIIDITSRDKKAKDGKARYTLPEYIGQMLEFDGNYATHVDNDIVMKALNQTR